MSVTTTDGGDWGSAALMPRGKDALGNDVLMFGDEPIRAKFDRGPRPFLALVDVLAVCGLHPKSKKDRYDIRGSRIDYPFRTSGGDQDLRVVDMDDAYRVAMQGRSEECRTFRDFLVSILDRIERGEMMNPKPGAQAPGDGSSLTGYLVQQSTMLHSMIVAIDDQHRRLAEQERRVAEVSEQINRIEARRVEAEVGLRFLPAPTVEAPQKSEVDLTEQRIRFWCRENNADFRETWRRFYEEIRRRLHFDVTLRIKKYSPRTAKLDVVRMEAPPGMSLPEFHAAVYAIACEMFPLTPGLAGEEA